MPPAYPTPAYFTPISSAVQGLGLGEFEPPMMEMNVPNPLLELPAVIEASTLESTSQLPWIDAFLSSTPPLAMASIPSHVTSYTPPMSDAVADAFLTEEEDEPALEKEWQAALDETQSPLSSDAWALDDAADKMRAFAEELLRNRGESDPEARFAHPLEPGAPEPAPLSIWSDDDLLDIMPAPSATGGTTGSSPDDESGESVEPWADQVRRGASGGSEAAAQALEHLARRVRDGDLTLVGYEPRLGDAAALAAALAALLGVRR